MSTSFVCAHTVQTPPPAGSALRPYKLAWRFDRRWSDPDAACEIRGLVSRSPFVGWKTCRAGEQGQEARLCPARFALLALAVVWLLVCLLCYSKQGAELALRLFSLSLSPTPWASRGSRALPMSRKGGFDYTGELQEDLLSLEVR